MDRNYNVLITDSEDISECNDIDANTFLVEGVNRADADILIDIFTKHDYSVWITPRKE